MSNAKEEEKAEDCVSTDLAMVEAKDGTQEVDKAPLEGESTEEKNETEGSESNEQEKEETKETATNTETPKEVGKQIKEQTTAPSLASMLFASGEKTLDEEMADKLKAKSEQVQEMCEKYDVDVIYENSKGEYFTELSYAVYSENGNKKAVETYMRNKEA